jgi:uncharacterized membrane protein
VSTDRHLASTEVWDEPAPTKFLDYLRRPMTLSAVLGFMIFWWMSLSPSLVPRAWLAQGIVSALSAASGYLIAAAIGWGLRQIRPWEGRPGLFTRDAAMSPSIHPRRVRTSLRSRLIVERVRGKRLDQIRRKPLCLVASHSIGGPGG